MVINPIVGVYIPVIRIPIKGGRSPIPNIATFDHGTCVFCWGSRISIQSIPDDDGMSSCHPGVDP